MNVKVAGIIIVVAGAFLTGFGVRGFFIPKTPAQPILKEVIVDTVTANLYRDQAIELRKEIDSLKKLPPLIKIKYEKIYVAIDTANSAELDSMYRAAMRHD